MAGTEQLQTNHISHYGSVQKYFGGGGGGWAKWRGQKRFEFPEGGGGEKFSVVKGGSKKFG